MKWFSWSSNCSELTGPHSLLSVHGRMRHWFSHPSRACFHNKKARSVHSHIHLAITGDCFTHSLLSHDYSRSDTRIVATKVMYEAACSAHMGQQNARAFWKQPTSESERSREPRLDFSLLEASADHLKQARTRKHNLLSRVQTTLTTEEVLLPMGNSNRQLGPKRFEACFGKSLEGEASTLENAGPITLRGWYSGHQ